MSGSWYITGVSLERLAPAAFGRLWSEARFLARRWLSLGALPFGVGAGQEPSVVTRLAETRAVLAIVREAGAWKQLLGHGLGARYRISAADAGGAGVLGPEERNYLHNFYAFLLYKTGVVGTLAVLAAMGLWLSHAWRVSRRAETVSERAIFAALFAGWLSYGAWGVLCPEILDFRMASIWGLTLAAMAVTGGKDRSPALLNDEGPPC